MFFLASCGIGFCQFLVDHKFYTVNFWLPRSVIKKCRHEFYFDRIIHIAFLVFMKMAYAQQAMSTVKTELGGSGPASSVATPTVKEQPAKRKRGKITDFGLASKLEESKLVREIMRSGLQKLIQWPTRIELGGDVHCCGLSLLKARCDQTTQH